MCFELSWRNASIFIIAPLSCSAPIYKDLLSSPLHLKFSFISAGVSAEPADSCSIFPPAAGKRTWGLPALSLSPALARCGTVAQTSTGVKEDAMVWRVWMLPLCSRARGCV